MNIPITFERHDDLSKVLIALVCACTLYLLILALIIFGIAPQIKKKGRKPFAHSRPSPVRWIKQPKPPTPTQQPMLPEKEDRQPQRKISPQITPKPKEHKPVQLPPLKTPTQQIQRTEPLPVVDAPHKPQKQIRVSTPPIPQNQTATSPPKPPLPSRATSRARWFKDSVDKPPTEKSVPVPHHQVAPHKSAMPSTFANHLAEWQKEQAEAGRTYALEEGGIGPAVGASNPTTRTRHLGFELFLMRLVEIVCQASRMQPMQTGRRRLDRHVIIVEISMDKSRHITNVVFTKPSPQALINNYIERLLRSINPPQPPADYPRDIITVPLRVRIELIPEVSEITLIPAYD
ncbi:MAG: hypothetical protein JW725_01915 [Candidatus Babeliaceae bacterium]|nr:hypothetical protein [Candidatus Babeliaceae bacterium]